MELSPGADWLTVQLAHPVDLEGVEVYIHPANVSLQLSIVDADDNWLSVVSASFVAPDALEAVYPSEGWVTRDLYLRRVDRLELKAATSTSTTAAAAGHQGLVDILELRLRATPSLPCAGGGFSAEEQGCETSLGLPDSLEALDCKGVWAEWSVCDTSCTRRRQFKVASPPKKGGKPCLSSAVEPCAGKQKAGTHQGIMGTPSLRANQCTLPSNCGKIAPS